MKQATAKSNLSAPAKPAPGRSRHTQLKSTAQRMREFHQTKKFNFLNPIKRTEK